MRKKAKVIKIFTFNDWQMEIAQLQEELACEEEKQVGGGRAGTRLGFRYVEFEMPLEQYGRNVQKGVEYEFVTQEKGYFQRLKHGS